MTAEHHPPKRRRDWRRIHHSPMFWVGLILCLGAISVYVLSQDLSVRPHTVSQHAIP